MTRSMVALVRCDTYTLGDVQDAVKRGIRLLGGISRFSRPGDRILLKPNLLSAELPDKCVTTHPSVFRAAAKAFIESGAVVSYGDSPAYQSLDRVAKKTGVGKIAGELGIPPADFTTKSPVYFEGGRQNKKFVLAKGVTDADGVISLPKLKAHGLSRITGCVKNQFGCVPGFLKGEFHVKLPDADRFGRMLVDLDRFISPRLYVMDAIWAMEGNGPRSGVPRHMGLLLFSSDPVALDATACRLIGLTPEWVPTISHGDAFGRGRYRKTDIQLVGDAFDQFIVPRFNVVRQPIRPASFTCPRNKPIGPADRFRKLLDKHLIVKPVVLEDRCIRCGVCINMCPTRPRSLSWPGGDKNKPPRHHDDTCIRCYCCQELCPEAAVVLKKPALRKIMDLPRRFRSRSGRF